MRGHLLAAVLLVLLAASTCVADIGDYLLPNGEPIVGVYYYSWFNGEPYGHVSWTPEFEYDNRNNDDHIYEVVKAMTDYGVNQASYSYWDNEWYLGGLGNHLDHARTLMDQGRECYFSPYLEPRTIDKAFASQAAQDANTSFIETYTRAYATHPAFCTLGGTPFTNIYVTYYQPDETDADFQEFLQGKYRSVADLRRAWTAREGYEDQVLPADAVPASFGDIRLSHARPGTVAFADRQELRAQRLKDGWGKVISNVRERTGQDSRYTGDVGRTIVSPTRYMEGLTGMSWYNFGYALTNPTRRPKLISEVAKFTDTTFLYTIAPGYVDRQQRWGGGRVERTPFLYPYAWTKAIQSLPEGIMTLTHSEWFEGSIIDVTKEFGKQQYETHELYSSIFRPAFPSIYAEKRDKEPVAIVFNEWATYSLYEGGANLDDVYGLIKLLECLNLEYDVIPESSLSAEELKGRQLVFVPNCEISLQPGHNEMLLTWARETAGATLVVDQSTWWANALGIRLGEGTAAIGRYRCEAKGEWIEPLGASFEGLKISDIGTCYRVGESEGDAPKILGRSFQDDGRGVIFFNGRLGNEFISAFEAAGKEGKVPVAECQAMLQMMKSRAPNLFGRAAPPPSESFEIKSGPELSVGDTVILPVGNVLPWGLITNHRAVGWGLDQGHSAENTEAWERWPCKFQATVQAGRPVAEIMAIDSDSGRFVNVDFKRQGNTVSFEYPVKFNAVFAIAQTPAKLAMPAMTLSPGQTSRFSIEASNAGGRSAQCVLRLKKTPGLTMEPVAFSLPARGSVTVPISLVAGIDYASGERTVAFEIESGGRTATIWRPVHCTLPACVGTRTTILGGRAAEKVSRQVTLVNVGEAPATDVNLKLLDGVAPVPDLAPGDQQTVDVSFTVPQITRSQNVPGESVSIVLGAQRQGNGLNVLSFGDGTVKDVTAGGRPATVAATESGSQMMYMQVDDAILPPGDYDLEAVVEYYDAQPGRFMIEYDATSGDDVEDKYKDTVGVSMLGTHEWKTVVIPMPGARLAGRQNGQADLRANGVVAIGKITLRGLRSTDRRVPGTMTVSYKQFGHDMTQDLALDVISVGTQTQAQGGEPTWRFNPYGRSVAGYSNGGPTGGDSSPAPGTLRVTDQLAATGLLVMESPLLSAVWDNAGGGLASLYSKATGADYAAFPGAMVPVAVATKEGEQAYGAPESVKLAGDTVTASGKLECPGGASFTVDDVWRLSADEPKLTLERSVTAGADVELADFCPAILRLSPENLDQTLPLGVGFEGEGQPKRGWLETWHSDGWYFCYSGDHNRAGHAVALTVRSATVDGEHGLRRFRYGFFPGEDLPAAADGTARGDELQIRLRGSRVLKAGDTVRLTLDIYVLPGASYKTARELALMNATPPELRNACTVSGDGWDRLGGIQTTMPAAPTYMFAVRQPYYSASLEGEEQ